MAPPATLSRAEFNQACQELARKASEAAQKDTENTYLQSLDGWAWVEDARVSGWGHLARTSISRVTGNTPADLDDGLEEELVESQDESNATGPLPSVDVLHIHECIVWHPTYMVPAYYFQVYDSSGSPANLSRILTTDRFQHRAFKNKGINVSEVVLQPQETNNAQFPLLSQGDHPVLGTPHWYFHPCETSAAVTEILAQMPEESTPLRWLEAWFAVLSTAINLA